MRKATQYLHNDMASGKLTDMPPIPSIETIRLQFVSNNAVVRASGNMTGNFNLCCRIKLQKLRNQHKDQHWVNNLTKYHKDWAVDVYNVGGNSTIRFVGQDSKSKIPGVEHVPVSTDVHIKHKGIV